jgi:PAS domain S-box-containing protein
MVKDGVADSGIGILVVEDSASQAASLQRILLADGYRVHLARNGVEGLEMARALRPALVITDILMPGMDGFELCGRIKDDSTLAGIPVILLTSLNDPADVIRGLEYRADNFITKPYDAKYLQSRVRHMLLSHELHKVEGAAGMGIEIIFAGQRHYITSDRQQILNLLLSTFESAVQKNRELMAAQEKLIALNDGLEEMVKKRTLSLEKEITERKKSEESLRKLSHAVEQSSVSITITDVNGVIEYVNPWFTRITGYTPEEVIGRDCRLLQSGEASHETHGTLEESRRAGRIWRGEFCNRKKNGDIFWAKAVVSPIKDDRGVISNFVAITEDVTELKNLEFQLRHSQKIEALGTLTGGIAHDFNNILTAIAGYCSLIERKVPAEVPVQQYIQKLKGATERATVLTRSLLSYSRKQPLNPRHVDLNKVLGRCGHILSRLLGEEVELVIHPAQRPVIAMVDTLQIEQVLMNMATNARDAMPEGGTLQMSTGRVTLDTDFVTAHDFGRPGEYALICIADSGCGMDAETRERIFEPFFTTKEVGKGTGLGLSIAYGIIKQHGGYINVYSEPGNGTAFTVYLPLAEHSEEEPPAEEIALPKRGSETVLLVEDDPEIRGTLTELLTEEGYRVIQAADGEEAVRKFRRHQAEVQFLILDVVMPRKNGRAAFEEIRALRPDIKALFISGYTADILNGKGIQQEEVNFMFKPISIGTLLMKMREVLERG